MSERTTEFTMIGLKRLLMWLSSLLENFDDNLLALDDDLSPPQWEL